MAHSGKREVIHGANVSHPPALTVPDFGGPGTGLHSFVVVRDAPAGTMLVEVLSDGASDLWLVLPDDGGG
jgi:hypothetical protein